MRLLTRVYGIATRVSMTSSRPQARRATRGQATIDNRDSICNTSSVNISVMHAGYVPFVHV